MSGTGLPPADAVRATAELRAARSLGDLCHVLLRHRLMSQLVLPLDDLLDQPEVPEIVAHLIAATREDVGVSTVAQLLRDPRALAALRRDVPPRLRRAILSTIRDFLIARLAAAQPASASDDAPPGTRKELIVWASERGLTQALRARAVMVVPYLPQPADDTVAHYLKSRQLTVMDLAADAENRYSPYGALWQLSASSRMAAQAAARAFLASLAGKAKAGEAEEQALLARPPPSDPVLARLFASLVELRRVIRAHTFRRPKEDVGAASVEFVAAARVLLYRERAKKKRVQVAIELPDARESGDLVLTSRCPCRDYVTWRTARSTELRRVPACSHTLSAIDGVLALLTDDRGELARQIKAELGLPAWACLLRGVAAIKEPASSAQASEARMAWRLVPDEVRGGLTVTAIVQRRGADGTYTGGKALRPAELARSRHQLTHPADSRVIDLVLGLGGGGAYYYRGGGDLPEQQLWNRAVSYLVGHPRVVLAGDADAPLAITRGELGLALTTEGGQLSIGATLDGAPLTTEALEDEIETQQGPLLVLLDPKERRGTVVEVPDGFLRLLALLDRHGADLPAEAEREVLERIEDFERIAPLALPLALSGREVAPDDRLVVRVRPLADAAVELSLLARPVPGGRDYRPGEGPRIARGARAGERLYATRDPAAEVARAEAVAALLALRADAEVDRFRWVLDRGEEAIDLVARLGEIGEAERLVVEWPESAWKVSRPMTPADLRLTIAERRDWFDVNGAVEAGDVRVEMAVLFDALRQRQRYVRVGPGRFVALAESLRRRLAPISDLVHETRTGLALSPAASLLLEDLTTDGAELDAPEAWRALVQRITDAQHLDPSLPAGFVGALRPYQLDGFKWMARLSAWGGGGILADDMGLGKTVEAVALLLHRAESGPALVVAPTSVADNWRRELERFAPSLSPVLYRDHSDATRDALLSGLGAGQVLITSYGLLARDAERLAANRFATLVVDEAQAVKNAATRRAKAARGLAADFKVALTGTPLENHVGELWSICRVVFPALLGSFEQFRRRFCPGNADAKVREERRQALAAVVRPFLLRRKKTEVAPELPSRVVMDVPVTLSAAERRMYEDARLAAVAALGGGSSPGPAPRGESLGEPQSGDERGRFQILAALTRLRLLACHPRLGDPDTSAPSAKLARLLEVVEELRAEGHRALVFSQFTKHLALVREALDAAGIDHLYLDGQTPPATRDALVADFQAGRGLLFLISLKAGGAGLNLTGADYVLHLDPWWNPAVEDQATDRAHRIGQHKPVTVLRLVALGTVEEKILSLHAEKRAMVAGVLDGTDVAANLTTEEMLELLATHATPIGDDLEESSGPAPRAAPTVPEARAAVGRDRAATARGSELAGIAGHHEPGDAVAGDDAKRGSAVRSRRRPRPDANS
jgi:superfamily II DNA or RNA helicase